MPADYLAKIRSLSPAKALAIAAYGESVAAYRYRTLVEKTSNEANRKVFLEMAEEEHGHLTRVDEVLKKHYPGGDFVLSSQDKEWVIVGPRLLEVTDSASFHRALEFIRDSERRTGRFYAAFHEVITNEALKPLLKEMADECFDHANRLMAIAPPDRPSADDQGEKRSNKNDASRPSPM